MAAVPKDQRNLKPATLDYEPHDVERLNAVRLPLETSKAHPRFPLFQAAFVFVIFAAIFLVPVLIAIVVFMPYREYAAVTTFVGILAITGALAAAGRLAWRDFRASTRD